MMGLLDIIFGGGINQELGWFLLALVVFIVLWVANKTPLLGFVIPDFLVGLSFLAALLTFAYWIGKNTILNLYETTVGKSIIVTAVMVLVVLLVVSRKFREGTKSVAQKGNPSKVGRVVQGK